MADSSPSRLHLRLDEHAQPTIVIRVLARGDCREARSLQIKNEHSSYSYPLEVTFFNSFQESWREMLQTRSVHSQTEMSFLGLDETEYRVGGILSELASDNTLSFWILNGTCIICTNTVKSTVEKIYFASLVRNPTAIRSTVTEQHMYVAGMQRSPPAKASPA